jgi:hypothetical protein
MSADSRVRITVKYQGRQWYFVRMHDERIPLLADFESICTAALLSREDAVARCQCLRAARWDAHVVTPAGVVLFDDVIAPPVAEAPAQDRVPMHVGDVLIVPGNPPRNGFYIRFPGTSLESIWGSTADDVYKKLVEHPRAAELMPLAERFVPPPEPVVDPRELQRKLQAEKYGRLRRPDLV